MGVLLYGLIKLVVYGAVCYVGMRIFSQDGRATVVAAALLGFLRFVMGLSLGLAIFLASSRVYASIVDWPLRALFTYLAVYVPVRWLEWSVIAPILVRDARTLQGFLFGAGARDRFWRLGGVVMSCLADIPMMLNVGGLPVGRFFC